MKKGGRGDFSLTLLCFIIFLLSPELALAELPGPFVNLPAIDESHWVIAGVRNVPYWKAGIADPVLTEACRLGYFDSLSINRIVVKFTGKGGRGFLQVVGPQHRHLLIDWYKMALPNETYYFKDTAMPDCRVWVAGAKRARSFSKDRIPPLTKGGKGYLPPQ